MNKQLMRQLNKQLSLQAELSHTWLGNVFCCGDCFFLCIGCGNLQEFNSINYHPLSMSSYDRTDWGQNHETFTLFLRTRTIIYHFHEACDFTPVSVPLPLFVCLSACVYFRGPCAATIAAPLISPHSPGQRSDVDCCSEEEPDLDPGTKLLREKERRSANNQRERYVGEEW